MASEERNWAGNYRYSAARIHYPETVEQIQELVARSRKVKALGSRHSFNAIADTTGDLICLDRFPASIAVDPVRRTVTIAGGVKYGPLCVELHQQGFALPNLASLPHISVAGACTTGTHGSGNTNRNLPSAVRALELVAGTGEIVRLSRERDLDRFDGVVVHMGAVGVVTSLTLDVLPTFTVRQDIYRDVPLGRVEESLDAVLSSAYSVSLFTDWRTDVVNQVWLKRRVEVGEEPPPEPDWLRSARADRPIHPIASLSAESCTLQMGEPGPWHERLPHFRMEQKPSVGDELQSEYMIPRERAVDALRAVYALRDRVSPVLQISEVRTIAGDSLWMSPCYGRDSLAIHFTWLNDWPAVRAVLPLIEERLAPFGARPHWGKLFTMAPVQVQALYARLDAFRGLTRTFDPDGKLRNAFLDRYILS